MKNMKKRILAIFLCLILTVSLAAAVAAENNVITPGAPTLLYPITPVSRNRMTRRCPTIPR